MGKQQQFSWVRAEVEVSVFREGESGWDCWADCGWVCTVGGDGRALR